MASIVQSFQVSGFPSVANGGAPASGTGLLGTATIEYWSDGAVIIVTAQGKRVRLEEDPQLAHLWSQILVGTNGLSTSKLFTKGA